ncbi:MAG: protein kinase [Planctomycetes bacterium]|nr:protein kinase [Planctomycetota bacterium]
MSESQSAQSEREKRLNEIIRSCLEAAQAGQPPSHDELIGRHPEFASEIRAFFSMDQKLPQLVEPQQLVSPVAPQHAAPGETATGFEVASQVIVEKGTPPSQSEPLPAGGGGESLMAGRYRILEQIGAGAMGTVYKAHDTKLDRKVALKMLPPQSVTDPDAVARFQREAKALAKLSHPNIIQAHDSDQDQGQHFLVMEYAEGTNLGQLLRTKGRIAPTLAAGFAYQVALGLQHAHEKGLVHRDLKPGNLLLTSTGEVKILDLGLARFLQDQVGDPTLTREGSGLGTPDYMAPEQFHDARHVDGRSDIYSLGCTLYHFISGRVPFPGSSLSEKCTAHEEREPPPLEESCPEAPGGLTLAVNRMMAKRPADRFQTASDVAEALAPYVASSSQIFLRIKGTVSWHGSQLGISVTRPRSRRLVTARLAAGFALAAVLLVLVAVPRFWRPHGPSPVGGSAAQDDERTKAEPQVVTIENGLTVAKDGTGQFATIGEALVAAQPGMTIRVLDNSNYQESLFITNRDSHTGITLESLQHATIEVEGAQGIGIRIVGVPRVTVRGFRFRAQAPKQTMVVVRNSAPGLLLDQLETEAGAGTDYDAITFWGVKNPPEEPPSVVQDCILRQPQTGFFLLGAEPCARIVIRNNRVIEPRNYGVLARGGVSQVQIVGNRLWGTTTYAAMQLHNLVNPADILIANNTIFDCTPAFRLWDAKVSGERIQLSNNLVLGATRPDMIFLDSGGTEMELRGSGDGKLVNEKWQVSCNWREVEEPRGDGDLEKSWIPPGLRDVRNVSIAVLSRTPTDVNFLRPAKDSPLASAGAGNEDTSLPTYVGAVPPEEAESWNWQKTWDERHPKMLLTVSKDAKDGGEFRSIGEALAKVTRRGMTVRVVDQGVYEESILLDDRTRYENLTLEAPQGATMLISEQTQRSVEIKDVPGIRLRGFYFRQSEPGKGSVFVLLSSDCAGAVLEDLDMQASGWVRGVVLNNVEGKPPEAPVLVARLRADVGWGISVAGAPTARTTGVSIRDNRVSAGYRGIQLNGAVADIHVTGNIVSGRLHAAIQIVDLDPSSRGILIANNSAFGSQTAFRVWDDPPQQKIEPGQVELRNNLFFDAEEGDMLYFLGIGGGQGAASLEMAQSVASLWHFGQNWRDLKGVNSANALPLGQGDRKIDKIEFLTRDPKHRDFMRPPKDSPMATAGAVGENLPAYVGAVPPEDAPPWDWDKTWKARVGQASDKQQQ